MPRPRLHPLTLLLPLLLALPLLLGQAHTDSAAARQIACEAFAAMDRQDYARFRELVPDEALIHIAGMPEPMKPEALVAFLKDYWKAFPDTAHTLHEVIVDGDRMAVHVTCQGTHRGEFEGVAPTGKVVRYDGVHLITLAKGRIRTWWVLDDDLGLMQQLGLRLAPGEAAEKGK